MKELKTEYLQIKLTPTEKMQLKRLAEINHLSLSSYIRVKCLNIKSK